MAYKVFYSYQTDIETDLNQEFIKSILFDIKEKVKDEELIISYGFRNSSGNPPLAQEMLAQASNCDVFIGDVTFTSAKLNLLKNRLFKLGKRELILKEKDGDKKSPNPNVLLETGFSWANHSPHNTILVMNTAFGLPNEMPVDMNDLRWPIKYHLCKKQLKDDSYVKSVRKELTKDLTIAIKSVIKSSNEHLRNRFLPFFIYKDWPAVNHSSEYLITDDLIEKIRIYRKELAIKGNVIEYGAKSDSGKTRFAYEIFREQKDILNEDENINKVFYFDMLSSDIGYIKKQLSEFRLLKQHKILIIDNCNNENSRRFIHNIVSGSELSCLLIIEEE